MKVEHYLLTMSLSPHVNLHAYVMTKNKRDLTRIANKMVDMAESSEPLPLPIMLQTKVSTVADLVREIVCSLGDEVKRCIEAATNFHCTIFMLSDDHPDDSRLMKLH